MRPYGAAEVYIDLHSFSSCTTITVMSSSNEKNEGILPSTQVDPRDLRQPTRRPTRFYPKFLLILIAYLAVRGFYEGYKWLKTFGIGENGPRCPQADILRPRRMLSSGMS